MYNNIVIIHNVLNNEKICVILRFTLNVQKMKLTMIQLWNCNSSPV